MKKIIKIFSFILVALTLTSCRSGAKLDTKISDFTLTDVHYLEWDTESNNSYISSVYLTNEQTSEVETMVKSLYNSINEFKEYSTRLDENLNVINDLPNFEYEFILENGEEEICLYIYKEDDKVSVYLIYIVSNYVENELFLEPTTKYFDKVNEIYSYLG